MQYLLSNLCHIEWTKLDLEKGYCTNIRANPPGSYFHITVASRGMKNSVKSDKVTVVERHRRSRSPLRNIRASSSGQQPIA